MFLIKQPASRPALLAILITWAFGLPASNAQTFALTDATALVPVNVKATAAEYKGRKAVLITNDGAKDGFALLKGVDLSTVQQWLGRRVNDALSQALTKPSHEGQS